jgi:hypothetical protein
MAIPVPGLVPAAVPGYPKESKDAVLSDSESVFDASFGIYPANMIYCGTTATCNVTIMKPSVDATGAHDTELYGNMIQGRWHRMPPFVNVHTDTPVGLFIRVGVSFE